MEYSLKLIELSVRMQAPALDVINNPAHFITTVGEVKREFDALDAPDELKRLAKTFRRYLEECVTFANVIEKVVENDERSVGEVYRLLPKLTKRGSEFAKEIGRINRGR